MGVRNQNSTGYEHPDEPNLLNIHKAMDYNSTGQPLLRTHVDGITLQGDVVVDKVKIWDGAHNLILESTDADGESGHWSVPTESYNMVFNGTTWDRMRGTINDGVLVKVSNWPATQAVSGTVALDTASLSALENINATVSGTVSIGSDGTVSLSASTLSALENINATVSGTVELGSTTLSALENITVGGTVTIEDGGGSITVDGTVTAVINEPVPIIPAVGAADFYGEPYSVKITPIVQVNSYEGIRLRDVQIYESLGGDVYENDTDIAVACSSTVGSYGVYRSRRFVPFRAGQSNVVRILAKFDTAVANTTQRIGIQNAESAYFVGYDTDRAFKFLHTYGGKVETRVLTVTGTASTNQTVTLTLSGTVYSVSILSGDTANIAASRIAKVIEAGAASAWLASQIDATVEILAGGVGPRSGTYSFTSTGNLTGAIVQRTAGVAATDEWVSMGTLPTWCDPTKYNQWQFQYNWLGVLVYALDPTINKWQLLFRHVQELDSGHALPVRKPSFKMAGVAYNLGGTSAVTLRIATMMGAIEGESEITSYTNGGGTTQASLASDTYWHVMSIQNPYLNVTDDLKLNFRSIRFMDMTIAAQCNDPVVVHIYFNQPLAGTSVYNFQTYPNVNYQGDTTKAAMDVTQDSPVLSVVVGSTGSNTQFNLIPYNLLLTPGTHMSLVAYSTAAIQKISIAGTWGFIG